MPEITSAQYSEIAAYVALDLRPADGSPLAITAGQLTQGVPELDGAALSTADLRAIEAVLREVWAVEGNVVSAVYFRYVKTGDESRITSETDVERCLAREPASPGAGIRLQASEEDLFAAAVHSRNLGTNTVRAVNSVGRVASAPNLDEGARAKALSAAGARAGSVTASSPELAARVREILA